MREASIFTHIPTTNHPQAKSGAGRGYGSAGQHHTGEGSIAAMIRNRSKGRSSCAVVPSIDKATAEKSVAESPVVKDTNATTETPQRMCSPTMCTSEASAIDSTTTSPTQEGGGGTNINQA